MPQSLSLVIVHVIFSTKDRAAFLDRLQVADQLTNQFRANAERYLQEDTESPDPVLRELMARVHKTLAAAASFCESCKEELPAESYQPVTEKDPASVAALAWSPARNGLRAALALPKQAKPGEPFALSWAVQNTGDEPVRLCFNGDGTPGMRWKGPEGSMNTSICLRVDGGNGLRVRHHRSPGPDGHLRRRACLRPERGG